MSDGGSFWEMVGAEPAMIAEADQIGMEAKERLAGILAEYKILIADGTEVPLAAVALPFFMGYKGTDENSLLVYAFITAQAIVQLVEASK